MSKRHTPGPWKQTPGKDGILAQFDHPSKLDTYWAEVAIVEPRMAAAPHGNCDAWSQANARLIAAAPDLLKACEQMTSWCDVIKRHYPDLVGLNQTIDDARDAIAKAKGE